MIGKIINFPNKIRKDFIKNKDESETVFEDFTKRTILGYRKRKKRKIKDDIVYQGWQVKINKADMWYYPYDIDDNNFIIPGLNTRQEAKDFLMYAKWDAKKNKN